MIFDMEVDVLKKRSLLSLLLLILFQSAFAAREIETIVIFRHAEKPTFDFGQLKCKGLNRSLLLPQMLIQRFGKPDYLFAPYPYWRGFYYYVRALVTLEPTAIFLKMPVSTPYYYHEIDRIADTLLSKKYHNALLFVTWEHKNITRIAKKIMSLTGYDPKQIPTWASSDFDSLYVFEIDWRVHPARVTFQHQQQNLNGLPDECTKHIKVHEVKKRIWDKRFLFVPASERQPELTDQLSCQGLNRALKLPEVFAKLAPRIDLFVLPSPDEIISSPEFKRSLMTLEPTIISRGGNYIPAGHEDIALFGKDQYAFTDTALIAWPLHDLRHVIKKVYKNYGGHPKDIPVISERDAVYEITVYDKTPQFREIKYVVGTPSEICPLS